jgi:hypothetical protein
VLWQHPAICPLTIFQCCRRARSYEHGAPIPRLIQTDDPEILSVDVVAPHSKTLLSVTGTRLQCGHHR